MKKKLLISNLKLIFNFFQNGKKIHLVSKKLRNLFIYQFVPNFSSLLLYEIHFLDMIFF